jgi:hypothetical protein
MIITVQSLRHEIVIHKIASGQARTRSGPPEGGPYNIVDSSGRRYASGRIPLVFQK